MAGQDYALSPQANQRKGGLLCLAAAAVGLSEAGAAYLPRIVPPVLDSFTDQDSRVRYYACEVGPTVKASRTCGLVPVRHRHWQLRGKQGSAADATETGFYFSQFR